MVFERNILREAHDSAATEIHNIIRALITFFFSIINMPPIHKACGFHLLAGFYKSCVLVLLFNELVQ